MNTRMFAVQFVGGPADGAVLTGSPDDRVPAGEHVVHRGLMPDEAPWGGWVAAYRLKCEISSGQAAHWLRYDFAGYERPQWKSNRPGGAQLGRWWCWAARRIGRWLREPIDFPFNVHRAIKADEARCR
jgi:hypothetical protein